MRAPVVAVGDAALGFGAALRDVWPDTQEQRCWVHRLANVLDKLPKRLQGKARDELRQIMNAAADRPPDPGCGSHGRARRGRSA
jgi:transposase-like protein